MPLDPSGLESDLASFFAAPPLLMDGEDVDLPGSRTACAQAWADAIESYATVIVPASTAVAGAAITFRLLLVSLFASATTVSAAASGFDTAMASFAAELGTGMTGFTATPPPAPLGSSSLLSTTQATHGAAAAAWKTKIDAWMKTGTATPIPSGTTVNWS